MKEDSSELENSSLFAVSSKCFFCGYARHPRSRCPAREAECKGCGKVGHYQKVCKSTKANYKQTSSLSPNLLSSLTAAVGPLGLERALVSVNVNGKSLTALIDTGSSDSYISKDIPVKEKWKIIPSQSIINMASTSLTNQTAGHCNVNLDVKDCAYKSFKL